MNNNYRISVLASRWINLKHINKTTGNEFNGCLSHWIRKSSFDHRSIFPIPKTPLKCCRLFNSHPLGLDLSWWPPTTSKILGPRSLYIYIYIICVCVLFNPTQISRTMGSHFTFISHHYGTLLAQSPLVAICQRPSQYWWTGSPTIQNWSRHSYGSSLAPSQRIKNHPKNYMVYHENMVGSP